MSEELRKLIKEVGDEIQPKLHAKPGHPKRIAHAHLYGMIKAITGSSYSEANFDQVKAIVEAIRQAPNGNLQAILATAKKIYEETNKEN